jgi:hypothetical protein
VEKGKGMVQNVQDEITEHAGEIQDAINTAMGKGASGRLGGNVDTCAAGPSFDSFSSVQIVSCSLRPRRECGRRCGSRRHAR